MRRAVLGLYTYFEFFACSVALLPAFALVALLSRGEPTRRRRGRMMRRFGRITVGLSPIWRFSVDGTPPDGILERGFVVIANHESTADPFLLSHLPWDMRWVAKEEIFKLPLIGWLMRLGGDIPLRRGKRDSVKQMLEECRRTLQNGLPVMFFPEGSRSKDGALGPFKDGAFQLAIETQVPVLPVAIAGTRQCRPKGSLWFGEACARARVLAPLSTKGMTLDDLPALRDKAREIIQRESERLRRDLGAMESRVPAEARS
jgi:1-acyl-sn-glycerol-3-phosphate acyltransferase